jgi:glycosyltransferase involved in cell wall biosynthesis
MKILVYPKDDNPYQELLYRSMRDQQPSLRVQYLNVYPKVGGLFFPVGLILGRSRGYRILHVHWPAFYIDLPGCKRFSYRWFRFCVWLAGIAGVKVVWTVHNVLPHEPQTSNDLTAAQSLASAADLTIVHSESTRREMEQRGLSTRRTRVVAHGSYVGVYPVGLGRAEARVRLGLESGSTVILFFGLVRPYKGVEELVDFAATMGSERAGSPPLRVVIAGKITDTALRARLEEANAQRAITLFDTHVPDDEVASYFAACDVVCLPFRKVTTSGSALLALSFGKPLIAPRIGALAELPDEVGYFYDPADADGLEQSLERAVRQPEKLAALGDAAAAFARGIAWPAIAAQTYGLYCALAADEPNMAA